MNSVKKHVGILILFIVVFLFTWAVNPNFVSGYSLMLLVKWTSLYAILGVGAAFVIISGGIDLSVGSVAALTGIVFVMVAEETQSVMSGLVFVMIMAALIGLVNGLLVACCKLQPFVVTLCGLMFYRSVARILTDEQNRGFSAEMFSSLMERAATGEIVIPIVTAQTKFRLPVQFLYLAVIASLAAFFFTFTVWGRHMYALGCKPEAARFSGIRTKLLTILSFVACSTIAGGLGGLLLALEVKTVQPSSFGNFYELYAIAAAVIGGCSLRGGEGTVFGVVIGAAIFQLLETSSRFLGFPSNSKDAVIAIVIVIGALLELYGRQIFPAIKAALMSKRPRPVAAVCVTLLLGSVAQFVTTTLGLSGSLPGDWSMPTDLSVPFDSAFLYIGSVLTLAAAIAMLNAKDWGRWLYLIATASLIVVRIYTSPFSIIMLCSWVFFALIGFLLLRPNVTAYFSNEIMPNTKSG
jgi:ribose transport system permease protein